MLRTKTELTDYILRLIYYAECATLARSGGEALAVEIPECQGENKSKWISRNQAFFAPALKNEVAVINRTRLDITSLFLKNIKYVLKSRKKW